MLGCTVVTADYLPVARALAASFADHHPGARFEIVVADDPADAARIGIDAAELRRRLTLYRPQALVSAAKPSLLRALLDDAPVILFDADMLVLAPLDDVAALARRDGIVLSPHLLVAPPHPSPTEAGLLLSGTYNGGLLAVGPQAGPFLDWWAARTARDCVWDTGRGIVLSQRWLDLVPSLFGAAVLRDRGVNLNVHGFGADDVGWEGGVPWIAGVPVRVPHFAGVGPWRSAVDPVWRRPGAARLLARWDAALAAAGLGGAPARGRDVPEAARHAYRLALTAAEASGGPEPPTLDDPGFAAWLAEPADGTGLSRFLLALYDLRADLQHVFPAVPGEHAEPLRAWAAAHVGDPHDPVPAGVA